MDSLSLISFSRFDNQLNLVKSNIGFALRYFYIRRSLRIFPLYFLVLFVATAFNKGEIRDAFFYNLSYTSNFYIIKAQSWPNIFSQFWSLSVEEHFYIFWPIIVLLFKNKITIIIAILVAISSTVFRYIDFTNSYDYFSVYIHTFSCLDVFMLGALLSFFFKIKQDIFFNFFNSRKTKTIFLTGLLISYSYLIIAAGSSPIYTWVFFRSIFGILCFLLIGFLVIGFNGSLKVIFENKLIMRGGKLSYAIYLIHNFVPGILLEVKKLELHSIIEFIIYFAVTILLSEILYRLVETPIRRFGNKYKLLNPSDSNDL